MTGTLYLDGKQYQYQDPEHLREILKRDYPNEPLPDWLTRKLEEMRRETKRREEKCPQRVPVASQNLP